MEHRRLFAAPIILLLMWLTVSSSYAQQKALVTFELRQVVTEEIIVQPKFALFFQDSIAVPFQEFAIHEANSGVHSLEFEYKPGRYTLQISKEGYQNAEKQFLVRTRRNSALSIGTIQMSKAKDYKLGEAVVKATHIKMVMRGDTLVYDAAAFELANGSMLDALVAQLPGAELKNGQIKVNGKHIESLMINGEDFFAGTPKVALENLPAYTVKNIKVYDRAANDAYLRRRATNGKKLPNEDEHMVMDVQLKKAYSTGWIGNAEANYGVPSDRYLGKAFGLGYSDRLRLAAFVNINNIKDTQAGNASGQWGGGWPQDGLLDLKMGGLDYLYKVRKTKVFGNLMLTHEDVNIEKHTSSVNYYNSGNVFGRTLSQQTDKKFHLISSHTLQHFGEQMYLQLSPSIDYLRNDYTSLLRTASFKANIHENYRLASLDSLYSPLGLLSSLAQHLLNSTNQEKEGRSGWFIGRLNGEATISFPDLGDNLEIGMNGEYRHNTDRPLMATHRFSDFQTHADGTGDRLSQRQDGVSTSYNINGGAAYSLSLMPYNPQNGHYGIVQFRATCGRQYNKQDDNYWKLREQLVNGAMTALLPPSAIRPEVLQQDLNNSVHSVYTRDTYSPGVEMDYVYQPDINVERRYDVNLKLASNVRCESLHYLKHQLDTTLIRWAHEFSPALSLQYRYKTGISAKEAKISYAFSEAIPSIYYLLPTVNDSDPTNIYANNPNLHRSLSHSVNGYYSYQHHSTHSNISFSTGYGRTDRAIAYARQYQRNTGITKWTPQNIDGNWNANASLQYSTPLGKKEAFQLQGTSAAYYLNSADFTTDTDEMTRSVVRNLTLSQHLGLTYQFGNNRVGLEGRVSWLRSRSELRNFPSTDAVDYTAKASGLFHLPQDWEIGSDINFYARRGYNDATLNTTHWVWNASLSKLLMRGNLVVKLTAVDLLSQISNLQYSINGQGRTETWINALPHYVMLGVQYRFHIMPKKKQ